MYARLRRPCFVRPSPVCSAPPVPAYLPPAAYLPARDRRLSRSFPSVAGRAACPSAAPAQSAVPSRVSRILCAQARPTGAHASKRIGLAAGAGRSRRRCGPVPAQMWASPGADVASPGADVASPGADVARPGADVARPGAVVASPGAVVARPGAAYLMRTARRSAVRSARRRVRLRPSAHAELALRIGHKA
jgi:hypothetical protein